MGIAYQIPHHSHYITSSNTFEADFNVPVVGQYSFTGNTVNQNQQVMELQTKKVYLIERTNIGGTIAEENYLAAISTIPTFRLKRLQGNEAVYFLPQPVNTYIDNQEITAWLVSEKKNDELLIDFDGVLNQTVDLVGIATVKINVSFAIYIIENQEFYTKFRDKLSKQIGDQISGAVTDRNLANEVRNLVSILRKRFR